MNQSNNSVSLLPLQNAAYPTMSEFASRLSTFSANWPSYKCRATPEDFAVAGLFYIGMRDKVKCFYCGGGLHNWYFNDSPYYEHYYEHFHPVLISLTKKVKDILMQLRKVIFMRDCKQRDMMLPEDRCAADLTMWHLQYSQITLTIPVPLNCQHSQVVNQQVHHMKHFGNLNKKNFVKYVTQELTMLCFFLVHIFAVACFVQPILRNVPFVSDVFPKKLKLMYVELYQFHVCQCLQLYMLRHEFSYMLSI